MKESGRLLAHSAAGGSMGQCAQKPKLHGKCPCFKEAERLAANGMPEGPPQLQLWKQLRHLYRYVECPAICHWLSEIVAIVSRRVDGEAERWGVFTLHKSGDAEVPAVPGEPHKRRRVDAHVKQWALQSAASGQQPSVAASAPQ